MATKTLAKINPERYITHQAGKMVHMGWDGHVFCFTREDFMCFANVLKQGCNSLYAACQQYSSVMVDNTSHEVWIDGICLPLTAYEYRKLLNAALMTETRLHGFREERIMTPVDHIDFKTVGSIRPPKSIRFYCN